MGLALDEEALPSEGRAAVDAASEVRLRHAGAPLAVVGSATLAIVGPLVPGLQPRRDVAAPARVEVRRVPGAPSFREHHEAARLRRLGHHHQHQERAQGRHADHQPLISSHGADLRSLESMHSESQLVRPVSWSSELNHHPDLEPKFVICDCNISSLSNIVAASQRINEF
jgi:hypothetical protein